jgi:alkylation response protein AidB-like acyl-CoA dehydrogenase
MAIAITEPDVGTDIPRINTKATKVDGGYLLNGSKLYNARLNQASHVILFVQSATGRRGDLTAFVVPINAEGIKIETLEAHGLKGNSFGGLTLTNLKVTDKHMLGRDGKAMDLFFKHFLYWRLMQTAAAIGTGEMALEEMADRIKTRKAFGGPIGRFTHLQQPLGQHKTELVMAFALAKELAGRIDREDFSDETRGLICGLKAEGVETSIRAVDAAMRAFGGEGYSTRVDLGQRLSDLQGLRIADGTTDVMRMEVVRNIYGREFWEMAIETKQPNKAEN